MSAIRCKTVPFAFALLLGTVTGAQAEEWLGLYPVRGELSLAADGRWRTADPDSKTESTEFEERLKLRLGGYSLDPQIFTFDVSLEPAFEQEMVDQGTGDVRTDTLYLDYGTNFSILHGVPASPFSLKGNFDRSTVETEGSLGSRSDSVIETRSGDLYWKFKPFPSTLSYTEQDHDESFYSGFGLPVTEREYSQKTLSYRGSSSRMSLYLDRNEFDDQTIDNNDYESEKAQLNNNFYWGKNSSFTSRLSYFNQEGFGAEERASADEALHIQHTNNLSTDYGYGYEALTRTTETITHRGEFRLNHRLYTNLDTKFRLSGSTTESDEFEEKIYEGSLDFNYAKQIRPDLRFSGNLGGGYGRNDRIGGLLDFSESFVVPGSGIVVLSQRFIVLTSIVVNAASCTPPPCTEGTDYFVEDAGSDFTQLRIPASSRISFGEQIDVDYTYQPPTADFSRVPYRIGMRLDYGSYSFYHSTVGEAQTFIDGPDPNAVGDRRTDTTGISWNWSRGRNTVTAGAERVYSQRINSSDTEYIVHQSLAYAINPKATLNLRLNENFLRDGTDVDKYEANLSVRWLPRPGLSVTPRLSAFSRSTQPGEDEEFMKAELDVRWSWRRLVTEFLYQHTESHTDSTGIVEDRVFFEVTRKF